MKNVVLLKIKHVSEHLSLGNNKESDYDAFKATFPDSKIIKLSRFGDQLGC